MGLTPSTSCATMFVMSLALLSFSFKHSRHRCLPARLQQTKHQLYECPDYHKNHSQQRFLCYNKNNKRGGGIAAALSPTTRSAPAAAEVVQADTPSSAQSGSGSERRILSTSPLRFPADFPHSGRQEAAGDFKGVYQI